VEKKSAHKELIKLSIVNKTFYHVIHNSKILWSNCLVWLSTTDTNEICKYPISRLFCDYNQLLSDEDIKTLPLKKLDCGNNDNFTDEGIQNLPLIELEVGLNKKFSGDVLSQLRNRDCNVTRNLQFYYNHYDD
jgi:hypothetical protein